MAMAKMMIKKQEWSYIKFMMNIPRWATSPTTMAGKLHLEHQSWNLLLKTVELSGDNTYTKLKKKTVSHLPGTPVSVNIVASF